MDPSIKSMVPEKTPSHGGSIVATKSAESPKASPVISPVVTVVPSSIEKLPDKGDITVRFRVIVD